MITHQGVGWGGRMAGRPYEGDMRGDVFMWIMEVH